MLRSPARPRLLAVAAVIASAATAPAAQAAPSITITSPTAGTTVSRAATPELLVTGTVAFPDPPAATARTWYVRRDACGGTAPQNQRLSVVQGTDGGDGCGNLLGVRGHADSWGAVDGVPATLGTGTVKATVVHGSFQGLSGSPGFGVGATTVTLTVSGTTAEGRSFSVSGSKAHTVVPGTPRYTTAIEVGLPAHLAGEALDSLDLTASYTQGAALFGFVSASGASWVTLPTLDTGTVEVATTSTFGSSSLRTATVAPDGTWEAEVPTPAAGSRTVYARAVQNGTRTVTSVPITVTG